MQYFGWARSFQDSDTLVDIPAKIRELERRYWLWMAASVLTLLTGVLLLAKAPETHTRELLIGLFLAVDGSVACAALKIWVHSQLATYRLLQELRDRD